jgi:ankyrin repeat protein
MILRIIHELSCNPNEETKELLKKEWEKYLALALEEDIENTSEEDKDIDKTSKNHEDIIPPLRSPEESDGYERNKQKYKISYHTINQNILDAEKYALPSNIYLEILEIFEEFGCNDTTIQQALDLYKANITPEDTLKNTQNALALSYRVYKLNPSYLWLAFMNPITISYEHDKSGIIKSKTTFLHEIIKAKRNRDFIIYFFELLNLTLSLNRSFITSYLLLTDTDNKSALERLEELQYIDGYHDIYNQIKLQYPALFFTAEQILQKKTISHKYSHLDINNILIGVDSSIVRLIKFFSDQNLLSKYCKLSIFKAEVIRTNEWNQKIDYQLHEFKIFLSDISLSKFTIKKFLPSKYFPNAAELSFKFKQIVSFIDNLLLTEKDPNDDILSPLSILNYGVNLQEIIAVYYFSIKHDDNWTEQIPQKERFVCFILTLYEAISTPKKTNYSIANTTLKSLENNSLVLTHLIDEQDFFDLRRQFINVFSNNLYLITNKTLLLEWQNTGILPTDESLLSEICNLIYFNTKINIFKRYSYSETIVIIHNILSKITSHTMNLIFFNINQISLDNLSLTHKFMLHTNNQTIACYELEINYICYTSTRKHSLKQLTKTLNNFIYSGLQATYDLNQVQKILQYINILMLLPEQNTRNLPSLKKLIKSIFYNAIKTHYTETNFLDTGLIFFYITSMQLNELYICMLQVLKISTNPDNVDVALSNDLQNLVLFRFFNLNNQDNLSIDELLIIAIDNNNFFLVKYLLHIGASPNTQLDKGRTALHYAVMYNHIEIIEIIINNENIIIQDIFGRTALHYACSNNFIDAAIIIDQAIDINQIINITDSNGYTPLYTAIDNSNEDLAYLLLSSKLNIENTSKDDANILILAISRNFSLETIRLLVKADSQCLLNLTNEKKNVIFYAINHKNAKELVYALFIKGASINLKDTFHLSPIFYAIKDHSYEIIRLLLELNANPWEYGSNLLSSLISPINQNTISEVIQYTKNNIEEFEEHKKITNDISKLSTEKIRMFKKYQPIQNIIGSFDIEDALLISIININLMLFQKAMDNISIKNIESFNLLLKRALKFISYHLLECDYERKNHKDFLKLNIMFRMIIKKYQYLSSADDIDLTHLATLLHEVKITDKQKTLWLNYIQNSVLSFKNNDIIEKLLEKFSIKKNTAITNTHIAILNNDTELLLDSLDDNIDELNIQTPYGNSPLMLAIITNSIESIEIILSYRPNVNLQNNFGCTALHLAIESHHYQQILQKLISFDVNHYLQDYEHRTAILYAMMYNNKNNILLLMSDGANPWQSDLYNFNFYNHIDQISKDNIGGARAFQTAIYCIKNNFEKKFKSTIQHITNINEVDGNGNSLLHHAVIQENINIVCILLNRYINIKIKNHDGAEAFSLMIKYSQFYQTVSKLPNYMNFIDVSSSRDSSPEEQITRDSFRSRVLSTVSNAREL